MVTGAGFTFVAMDEENGFASATEAGCGVLVWTSSACQLGM